MRSFMIFTHPDPECSGSSLSSRREGEEGESVKRKTFFVFIRTIKLEIYLNLAQICCW